MTQPDSAVPRFPDGALVRIRDLPITGHMRTPRYVRNHVGVVERYCGAWPNPEELAFGKDGLPPKQLFRVRLRQTDIWPDYTEDPRDTLEIEIYEHWLEPVETGEAG